MPLTIAAGPSGFEAVVPAPSGAGAALAPLLGFVGAGMFVGAVVGTVDRFQQGLLIVGGLGAAALAAWVRLRAASPTAWLSFDGSALQVTVGERVERFGVGELVSASRIGRQVLLRRVDGLVVEILVDPADPRLGELVHLLDQLVAVSVARADDADARAARSRVRSVSDRNNDGAPS